jgi:hypothetical protein
MGIDLSAPMNIGLHEMPVDFEFWRMPMNIGLLLVGGMLAKIGFYVPM